MWVKVQTIFEVKGDELVMNERETLLVIETELDGCCFDWLKDRKFTVTKVRNRDLKPEERF